MSATQSSTWVRKALRRCQGNVVVGLMLALGLLLVGVGTASASVVPGYRGTGVQAASPLRQGVTIPVSLGARVALPSAQHSAFPGAVRLPNGRLLAVWRQGSTHLSFDGVLRGSTSADNGRTWTAATTMLAWKGTDLRDPSLAVVGGTLYMTFCVSVAPSYAVGAYVARSTDNGRTWDVSARLDRGMARAGASGPLVSLDDGRLLQVFYGRPAGEPFSSTWSAVSDDQGVTWDAPQRVLDGPATGRDYEEPYAMHTQAGTVRVFVRWGGVTQVGSIEYDGATWSNGHALWAGSGRPSCSANGARVLCIYRAADPLFKNRPALYRTSTDGGRIFSAARTFDATTTFFAYAAPVPVGTGWVVIYSMQSGSTATVYARTVGATTRSYLPQR